MKQLLQFILENIVDKDDFVIEEKIEENRFFETLKVNKEKIGIIIGKEGKTIKALQDLLRIKAKLEGSSVFVSVEEKER